MMTAHSPTKRGIEGDPAMSVGAVRSCCVQRKFIWSWGRSGETSQGCKTECVRRDLAIDIPRVTGNANGGCGARGGGGRK